MNIFSLQDKVITDYQSYVMSFLRIRDHRIADFVNERMESGVLWPEPLVQLSPAYETGPTVEEIVARGKLRSQC